MRRMDDGSNGLMHGGVRGRDARIDNVEAITLKENTCLLFMEIITSQNPIHICTETPLDLEKSKKM